MRNMLRKFGRLFTIKTRLEAWLVIYAIALGAVERGVHYLQLYPNSTGLLLALACTSVVFIGGAKLLDSVRPGIEGAPLAPAKMRTSRPIARRNRPTRQPRRRFATSPISRRTN